MVKTLQAFILRTVALFLLFDGRSKLLWAQLSSRSRALLPLLVDCCPLSTPNNPKGKLEPSEKHTLWWEGCSSRREGVKVPFMWPVFSPFHCILLSSHVYTILQDPRLHELLWCRLEEEQQQEVVVEKLYSTGTVALTTFIFHLLFCS